MKIRNYEKLILNLPQLQDRIKRDKDSYRNEVRECSIFKFKS